MTRTFDNERVRQLLDVIESDTTKDERRDERSRRRHVTIAGAWRHVNDYVGMVAIAADRWRTAGSDWAATVGRRFEAMKQEPPGPRPVTPEELREMRREASKALALRLDEESLYLFGNILLDRLALAIKHTLFDGSTALDKHSDVAKSLAKLADERGLHPPARLLELATTLEDELSEKVRDTLITHATAPGHVRTGFGRSVNIESGETSLSPFVIDPRNEAEMEPRAALRTAELVDHLIEYANEVAAWVLAVVTERR